MGRGSE
jgi:hypothetical protein